MRANFDIVENSDTRVVLRDVGPWSHFKTITNEVEAVVWGLLQDGILTTKKRLFYYDSENEYDEIAFNERGFTEFKVGAR